MTARRLSLIALPLLVLIGVLVIVVAPQTAEAHALLARSDPAANAQLKGPPTNVNAFFTEALDTNLSKLQVVDSNGDSVDDGNVQYGPDPAEMSIGLKETLGPGYYTVVWETLSAVDGHLFKGFYTFTVLNADGTQPAGAAFQGASSGGTTAKPDTVGVRWGRILGITAILGGLAFFLVVVLLGLSEVDEPWRKRWRDAAMNRVLVVSAIACGFLVIVALGELYVQSDQLGGLSYVSDVLKGDWGTRWIQRQIALACIAVTLLVAYLLAKRGRDGFAAAALGVGAAAGVIYALLIAMVSHGNSISGAFWATGADTLHIIAASVWIGMLFQLVLFLAWLRRDIPEQVKNQLQGSHLSRFGTIAATSVIVLLATGVANAVAQLSDWQSLYDTAYGRTLLIKLGIMVVLLLAAAVNAFYLRPRMVVESDEGRPTEDIRRKMSIAVRVELGLGLAVLLAAAALVLYPTGRQIRDAEAFEKASTQAIVGYEIQQPSNDGQILVDFTVSPNTPGFNSFRVFIFPTGTINIPPDPSQPGGIIKVRLRISNRNEDLGQQLVDMEPVEGAPYAFKAAGPYLTKAGQWDFDVTTQLRGLEDETVTIPVQVSDTNAGGQFAFPFSVGSWLSVGMAVMMVVALLAAIWISEWPGLPQLSPRFLRVGTATLTVLGAGILVLSLIPTSSASDVNPIEATDQSIAAGHNLYVANCSKCHGINGDGNGEAASTLPVKPADFRIHVPYHDDATLFRFISKGVGQLMPAWETTLSEEDRWNLVNYLRYAFQQNAGQPSGTPAPSPTPSP